MWMHQGHTRVSLWMRQGHACGSMLMHGHIFSSSPPYTNGGVSEFVLSWFRNNTVQRWAIIRPQSPCSLFSTRERLHQKVLHTTWPSGRGRRAKPAQRSGSFCAQHSLFCLVGTAHRYCQEKKPQSLLLASAQGCSF